MSIPNSSDGDSVVYSTSILILITMIDSLAIDSLTTNDFVVCEWFIRFAFTSHQYRLFVTLTRCLRALRFSLDTVISVAREKNSFFNLSNNVVVSTPHFFIFSWINFLAKCLRGNFRRDFHSVNWRAFIGNVCVAEPWWLYREWMRGKVYCYVKYGLR